MHSDKEKERNISLSFRPQDVNKHFASVEALLIPSIPNNKIIFTASRDSTVKRWGVSGPEPVLEASFEGHADWVNDLALIGDLLITCSNDRMVRLWRAGSDSGRLLHTLAAHSDYVTRLAAAPDRRLVVSAGLQGEVFSYDVEVGMHTRFQLRGSLDASEGGKPKAREEAPCSVYSLALSSSAWLLAAGTSESLVRLVDPRVGAGVGKLRGHLDVVRALSINSSGTQLVSGASDGSIKMWDVGMRRCIQTLRVHADSVWSLQTPEDSMSYVYSGGRDRALYRTNTHTCVTELLALENQPVRALAVDMDARPPSGGFGSGRVGLWAATLDSHVNMWLVPAPGVQQLQEIASVPMSASRTAVSPRSTVATNITNDAAAAVATIARTGSEASSELSDKTLPAAAVISFMDGPSSSSSSTASTTTVAAAATNNAIAEAAASSFAMQPVSHTPLLQSGRSFPALHVCKSSLVSQVEPLVRKPVATIPGLPAIVHHEILADCRRVLTRDARGYVALWDVLLGTEMVLYGKADFATKLRELWEARSVPPWFTCDHRLGCLSITLTPSAAFCAEEYAVNVGFGDVAEDLKINYGKLVLECIFAKWIFMMYHDLDAPTSLEISRGRQSAYGSDVASHLRQGSGNGDSADAGSGASELLTSSRHRLDLCGSRGEAEQPYYTELWPKYWQIGAVPAVMGSRADGQRWRRLLTDFDGSEIEPDDVPTWVADVILRDASVASLTVTFYLLPVKGSNLPTLSITRLQGPHLLEAQEVAKYCCEKLQEHGIQLEVLPGNHQRIPLAPLHVVAGGTRPQSCMLPYRVLEFTCNGMAVPYDMNLSSVKKFLWREQEDLTFHYGVRDSANPAPYPLLGPTADE